MSDSDRKGIYLNKETAELARDPGAFFARNSGFLFLFCVIVPWPLRIILGLFRDMLPAPAYLMISSLAGYAVMLAVCGAFIAGYRQRVSSGIRGAGMNAFVIAICAQGAVYPFLLFVSELCAHLIPGAARGIDSETMGALAGTGPFGGYIVLALVPAVTEELICRGAVYGALRKSGACAAVIFSTLCFALMHRDIGQMIYTALFGVLLCFIREYSGSVFPCMLAHLAFNTGGFLLIYFPYEAGPDAASGDESFMGLHWPLLAAGVAGLAGAVFLLKALRRSSGYVRDGRPESDGPEASLPMLPYAIGWAICLAAAILL